MQIKQGDAIFCNGVKVGVATAVQWTTMPNGYMQGTIEISSQPAPVVPNGAQKITAVFGNPGWKKPYRGNLVGNIRIQYRLDDYAYIYVRDPYRIRKYLLRDEGDYVTTGVEVEQNQRTTPRTK